MSGTSASDTQGTVAPLGLIGGIGLTEVHVYTQRPAPDGLHTGCPHVHAVTDEGYLVLRGRGAVEFHDLELGYRTLRLEPGQYVHFPPLVMHRLISDGDLVILGMMGSAGLAERGEARIYFGADVDRDVARYQALVSLPHRMGIEGALQRRDAAVSAYVGLLGLWREDRPAYFAELRRFFSAHCAAMADRREELRRFVLRGPLAWGAQTLRRLDELPRAAACAVQVQFNRPSDGESALGMCGVLRPICHLQSMMSNSDG